MTVAILFARDPGAANHVVAVADVLAGRLEHEQVSQLVASLAGRVPDSLTPWALGPAITVFRAAGLEPMPTELPSVADAAARLAAAAPSILLTGTGDVDDQATRNLWQAARHLGIPSIAALDSPGNAAFRFDVAAGVRPDRVIATDASADAALRAVGFVASDVLVAGDLHLRRLVRGAKVDRGEIRGAWGVEEANAVVLFVSENGAEARALGRPVDFDEFKLLEELIARAAAGDPIGPLRRDRADLVVVVRPHPRDAPGKYDAYVQPSAPRVIVSAHGSPVAAAIGADLVVGMRSAFLNEAHVLGRPVYRLV